MHELSREAPPVLETRLIDGEPVPYTGVELRPHFLLTRFGLKGNAIAAFQGPCSVATNDLVDWEDRLEQDFIKAKLMLHFLGEFFGMSLREAVLLQRLFIARLGARLDVEVDGNDLFLTSGEERRKLSVSIVTSSAVSQLMHIGINIDFSGSPVPAAGLLDLGIDPMIFAAQALEQFQTEWKEWEWACSKVRPVG